MIATGNAAGARSPKADAIAVLDPEAFVDDYLPYLRGMPSHVHTALVLRAPNGSPNTGDDMSLVRSVHDDLGAFASHWLQDRETRLTHSGARYTTSGHNGEGEPLQSNNDGRQGGGRG